MALIACDTDFLIKVTNDPVPALDWGTLSIEHDFAVMPCVIAELKGLATSKIRKTSIRAKSALAVVEEGKKFKRMEAKESSLDADSALYEFVRADPSSRMIATLDGSLLSRMEKAGLPYLTLSSGKPLLRSYRGNVFNR